MKVLNFGSLNIDFVYQVDHFVQKGETIASRSLHTYSGGKGLNQSIALAKAKAEVYHAGAVGEDGGFLIETLKEAGVHTDYILMQKEVRTGNAIIQNDSNGDNCIILFGGANQNIKRSYVDQVLENFEKGDYLVLQNEINELKYIVEKAHEKGMIIVLNPSPMNEKVLELPLSYVDYFIFNEIEGAQLAGSDKTECELLEKLHIAFPNAKLVLTLGEKGSFYYDGRMLVKTEAVKVNAVDTTAAGDTYTGFLVAGLMRRELVGMAMKTASVASAIAVTRHGASPSIPTAEEVEEMLKEKM